MISGARAPRASSPIWPTWSRTARPRRSRRKLEADDSAAERFDFARSDYRVLIALREDYLAPLEGLKSGDAEHHAEPAAAGADDRHAGAGGGAAARQGAGHRGSGRGHRALRRRRRRDRQRRGRALAAEPDLPRTQRCAHRAGPQRDLARPAGRLARHHPQQLLRALARRSAAAVRAHHRGRAADRLRLSRERRRGARCVSSFRRSRRGARHARSCWSTAGCCASRSAWTCAASSSRTTCCAASSRPAATSATSAKRARPPSALLAEQRERELAARRALVRARQVAAVCGMLAVGAIVAALFAVSSSRRAVKRRTPGAADAAGGRAGARRSRAAAGLPER